MRSPSEPLRRGQAEFSGVRLRMLLRALEREWGKEGDDVLFNLIRLLFSFIIYVFSCRNETDCFSLS